MAPRPDYERAVALLRPHGEVSEQDFYPDDGRAPYRFAQLIRRESHEDAPTLAMLLAKVAIKVDGFFTFTVHKDSCVLTVSVHRDLDALDAEVA